MTKIPQADSPLAERFRLEVLGIEHTDSLLKLDQLCFGGQWTRGGFEAELTRPPRDPNTPDRPSAVVLGAWCMMATAQAEIAKPVKTLVGFSALWMLGEEGHIILLGVDPQHRRQGVGRSLIQDILRRGTEQGIRWATLEVRQSNGAALQLYQSLGFKSVGQRKNYYSDPTEDANILWKQLRALHD